MPELSPESLINSCDQSLLDFRTTAELPPLQTIIGQERAVNALNFGLDIQMPGFNIYAAGPDGTGKTSAITSFLKDLPLNERMVFDWCYVSNYRDTAEPVVLRLLAGQGRELEKAMTTFTIEAVRGIARAFDSDEYSERTDNFNKTFGAERERVLNKFRDQADSQGFLLQSSPVGLTVMPQVEGRLLTESEILALAVTERQVLVERKEALENDLKEVISHLRNAERHLLNSIQELDRQIVRYTANTLIQDLKDGYHSIAEVVHYLDETVTDMIENVDLFRKQNRSTEGASEAAASISHNDILRRYKVNVIVDNSQTRGAPVVLEVNPTVNNLLGRIDREARYGTLQTDSTMIRSGSLHRANGGFLIIRASELIRNSLAWEGLKRSLKEGKVVIEETGERMGAMTTRGLTPQPIPLDVKVVLIGEPSVYHGLYTYDPDFVELFKVKAEFDDSMHRTADNIRDYAAFISFLCEKEQLLHLDRSGTATLIDHSSRLAENQEKLSTKFAEISDVVREASYWATKDGSSYVNKHYVNMAVGARLKRSALIADKTLEIMHNETISIDTEGYVVGQINGLAVMSLGDFSFGRPGRITVTVGLGRDGVIDIERESSLGGRLHTKGVLILAGYIVEKLSGGIPLSLSARLTFEQSYSEIDGDSASSAELYALISHLADTPLNQGIAVTGSVDQKGYVQPIGGVNHKIEGFFDLCKAKGLTGGQGVMVPAANVQHLMLREDVVEAVAQGTFHIYSAKTIDEGIGILTGVSAGNKNPDGSFEDGSVNEMAATKLREMATEFTNFLRGEEWHSKTK